MQVQVQVQHLVGGEEPVGEADPAVVDGAEDGEGEQGEDDVHRHLNPEPHLHRERGGGVREHSAGEG